jgi:hypothetical protein
MRMHGFIRTSIVDSAQIFSRPGARISLKTDQVRGTIAPSTNGERKSCEAIIKSEIYADLRRNIRNAHPAAVRSRDQRRQAIELRKGGATYSEIGEALGVKQTRAYYIVMAALDELGTITREGAAQVKQLEIQRLDSMLMGLWPQRKNPRVVDTLLRIQERGRDCLAWMHR